MHGCLSVVRLLFTVLSLVQSGRFNLPCSFAIARIEFIIWKFGSFEGSQWRFSNKHIISLWFFCSIWTFLIEKWIFYGFFLTEAIVVFHTHYLFMKTNCNSLLILKVFWFILKRLHQLLYINIINTYWLCRQRPLN